jgi:hypothetical protein
VVSQRSNQTRIEVARAEVDAMRTVSLALLALVRAAGPSLERRQA